MINRETEGRCPHCGVYVRFVGAAVIRMGSGPSAWVTNASLGVRGREHDVHISSASCPSCGKPILTMNTIIDGESTVTTIHPLQGFRYVPEEVPEPIVEDFNEAVIVLPFSSKASAALSRRCLQNLLVDRGASSGRGVTLSQQIDWASNNLPEGLRTHVDYIREVGNFAAHPIKDTNTGEVVEVVEGEAEWNLDVLEELFEHYYVQPEKRRRMIEDLNKKLQAAGKRPLS